MKLSMMDGALQVCHNTRLSLSIGQLTRESVFSAPKYCDSTENKGAYINIGPELKLDFHKFDAVPHPDIKPMVSPKSC